MTVAASDRPTVSLVICTRHRAAAHRVLTIADFDPLLYVGCRIVGRGD